MEEAVKSKELDGVALVTINRPEYYNSFDVDTIQLLAHHLITLALDPGVVGVVISGEGKAFCTGGDLRWITGCGKDYAVAYHELSARFHQAILEIQHMPKPVVAAVNGIAAGGGFSLALACDFRIMETSAVLRQGYTSNGLSIDGGGSATLPRLVGLGRAMEIAAFDKPIDSEKAYSWGMVTEVVDDGWSVERAVQMIEELKQKSLSSFAASKKLITGSFDTTFEAQLEKERELLSWCGDHPNGREGVAAFLEKRKPVYNKAV